MLDLFGQYSDYVTTNTALKPNLIPKHALRIMSTPYPLRYAGFIWPIFRLCYNEYSPQAKSNSKTRSKDNFSAEFLAFNASFSIQDRIPKYESIGRDFNNYSVMGKELVAEVKKNITSDLRPAERTRYIKNLTLFIDGLKIEYEYIESDRWLDHILADFRVLPSTGSGKVRFELTDMDRECIFRVAEDVRTCFYEFTKAVEEITAESRDPMIGVFTMPSYHGGYLNQIPAQQTNFVEPIRKEITSINTDSKLEWKGDKTDLAELVWALSKSNRIIDTTTAQPVTQKELTRRIETLLGVTSLDVAGLMKGRMNTYKATNNGNTFVKTLFNLVSERAANS